MRSAYPAEELAARAIPKPEATESVKPRPRIETTTVDTGERQEMFGHMDGKARHHNNKDKSSRGLSRGAPGNGHRWLVYRSRPAAFLQ
jgi:hypothetical protein